MDIKQLYQLYQKNPVITTDSRNCPEGSIFFALKGASFDGNLFAIQALEKGCAYAVIDDPQVAEDKQAEEKGLHDRLILVERAPQTVQHPCCGNHRYERKDDDKGTHECCVVGEIQCACHARKLQ